MRVLPPNAGELLFPRDSVNVRLEPDHKQGRRSAIEGNTIYTLYVSSKGRCTVAPITDEFLECSKRKEGADLRKVSTLP